MNFSISKSWKRAMSGRPEPPAWRPASILASMSWGMSTISIVTSGWALLYTAAACFMEKPLKLGSQHHTVTFEGLGFWEQESTTTRARDTAMINTNKDKRPFFIRVLLRRE